jgi:hypothetical protein
MRVSHHSKLFVRILSAFGSFFLMLMIAVPASAGGKGRHHKDRDHPRSAELDGWSVKAYRPQVVGENLISGKFVFRKEKGEEDVRNGGACLVADLNDNYPCETREDCLDAQASGDLRPTPPGGFIYCDSVNGRESKRCWTRPGPLGCSRGARAVNKVYEITPAPTLFINENSQPEEGKIWITLACLATETNALGCGSLDPTQHVYDSSPKLDLREDEDDDCD